MNAHELADKLEQGHWESGVREQAATMLRKQADRLAEIEKSPPVLIQIIDSLKVLLAEDRKKCER
jgi:hypothetical protein